MENVSGFDIGTSNWSMTIQGEAYPQNVRFRCGVFELYTPSYTEDIWYSHTNIIVSNAFKEENYEVVEVIQICGSLVVQISILLQSYPHTPFSCKPSLENQIQLISQLEIVPSNTNSNFSHVC